MFSISFLSQNSACRDYFGINFLLVKFGRKSTASASQVSQMRLVTFPIYSIVSFFYPPFLLELVTTSPEIFHILRCLLPSTVCASDCNLQNLFVWTKLWQLFVQLKPLFLNFFLFLKNFFIASFSLSLVFSYLIFYDFFFAASIIICINQF